MSVLLLIPILLLAPALLALMHRFGMRFGFIWAAAAGLALVSWLNLLLAAWSPQATLSTGSWAQSLPIFGNNWFILDQVSWPAAFALTALGLSAVLTSLTRLPDVDWRSLAGVLALLGFGLTSVFAASIPVLLLAWSALDVSQLTFSLSRVEEQHDSARAVTVFSSGVAGTLLVVLALAIARAPGISLMDVPVEATGWLLLAAGVRLGLLPLQMPIHSETQQHRGTGLLLRLVPAASVLVLLARLAEVGVSPAARPFFLFTATAVGVYMGSGWLLTRDDLPGRTFWIMGSACLCVMAVVQHLPQAVLALGHTILLGSGLLWMTSYNRGRLRWLFILMLVFMSALPFSPTWPASELLAIAFWPVGLAAAVVSAMLLLGYARKVIRQTDDGEDVVGGVNALSMIGLAILPISMVFAGWSPVLRQGSFSGAWWEGALVLPIAAGLVLLGRRGIQVPPALVRTVGPVLSLRWINSSLLRFSRITGNVVRFVSRILEGEASVIWALVLLALLITLFSQLGVGS